MPHRDPRWVRALLLAALLSGALCFVYRGVGDFDFVNLDDPDYTTQNPMVREGLRWRGVWWAFTAFHAANWLPLTWLSHMADASLFGMDAGAHHLVSLGLHAASTLVLFQLLRALSGSFWRSVAVAALFAVHPVQVESVAWIAERKTVLATLLGLLTIGAYLRYVKYPVSRSFPGVVVLFAVGLLAKPMLVILPFLLLLLDWWPLGRFPGGFVPRASQDTPLRRVVPLDKTAHRGRSGITPGDARSAVVEKAPLFVIALLSGIVTIAAQSRVGGIASLRVFPLPARLGNALLSCAAYLGDLFLPHDLTVFYAHPSESLPWGRAGLAALALAAVTLMALRAHRAAPYAAFGWLWYLVTLFPVLGILQVGSQARADRYLYLPLVGIFLSVVWGAADFSQRQPRFRTPLALALAAAGSLFALAAHRQAGYWQNSVTLWEHALSVDPKSQMALYQLSDVAKDQGRRADQAAYLRALLLLNPRHESALNNLVIARYQLGEKPEALLADYQRLLVINPQNAKALQNYGYLLVEAGRSTEAIAQLQLAVAIDPTYCTALNTLGAAYLSAGDRPRARLFFERAATCDPKNTKFRANLDRAQ